MTAVTLAAAISFAPASITFPDGLPSSGGTSTSARLGIFKAEPHKPAFKQSGSAVVMRAGVEIELAGQVYAPTTDQTVTLPTLVAGTDYRIAVKTDGTLEAFTYAAALPEGAKVIGGFHYLSGTYPTGFDQGGGWTPSILEWSFWDLNYRPSCPDPRGMTRVGSGPWVDIYFQGDSSNADGVSRNNDPILTGDNPPAIPADYGGDGTTKYSTMNWWEANEHIRQWGKRLPTYDEMVLAGFGTNEGNGRGSHPIKTGFATHNTPQHSDPNFTSKWGLIQSTGVIWIWTATLSDWQGTATANSHGWEAYDVAGQRGKVIMQNNADLTALLYGGSHIYTDTGSPTGVAAVAGSRATETIEKLWDSSINIAIRGACDHYWR